MTEKLARRTAERRAAEAERRAAAAERGAAAERDNIADAVLGGEGGPEEEPDAIIDEFDRFLSGLNLGNDEI